jgi:class 3 adenylate cyclase/tetratricopeptide (TPR) repeat protein
MSDPRPASANADLQPYLPRIVGAWGASDRARVLDGSLVSVDVSGFTSLSERLAAKGRVGAEELIAVISGCFEGLIGIAERFGGDVLKFRGDALLLLHTGDGHERRAVRAAADMQWFIEHAGSRMSSVGPVDLRMSTGVFSGDCHLFLVESSHRELVVTGPAATATVELEDLAEAGEVLVSARTAAAVEPSWLGGERSGARLLALDAVSGEQPPSPQPVAAAADLEAYVPTSLRAHLAVTSAEAEHRKVTVAFVKFGGADELLSAGDPGALLERLDVLGEAVGRAGAQYGITWLESDIDTGGGKLYLTAGAPVSTGDDEEGMLRALRDIVDADHGLPLRAGVSRGHVFAGDIGAATRRTYAVMGDTVNLAARLVGRAGPGEIVATADVLERARTRYDTGKQPLLVKGKERPVTAYTVGPALAAAPAERAVPLPLVGRERELGVLRDAVEAARLHSAQLVEIVGEPGIGKSRLVEELKTLAVGFAQLESSAEQYARSVPYFAFRGILRQLAGITPEQSREEAGARLAPWIQTVMPDLAPWLPLLAIPFDAEVAPTPEVTGLDPARSRDRLHEVLDQFLQRVLMMPTLLDFEDVHWLDDASRFLLLYLTSKPAARPTLVVTTRRPEGEPLVREGGEGTTLALEPLAGPEGAKLALLAAGEHALPESTVEALIARAGGNPLFVRELVAAARAGGDMETLPESVETLLTSRIDALDASDRMLLRYAAVVGASFDLDLLAEILGDEIEDVRDPERWRRLGELVERADDDLLRFRHDLVRATAYEGLSFRRRREIHRRVASAIERRAGDDVDAVASLLSLHFFEAGDHEQAWRYSVLAGDAAQERLANVVASELYERALKAGEQLAELAPGERARVCEALGDVCERFARYERAAEAYADARTLLGADPLGQARLLRKEGVLGERSGNYELALRAFEAGLGVAEDDGGPQMLAERAELEVGVAGVHYRQGAYDECIRLAERAVEHAEDAHAARTLAHAYYLLDAAHTDLGSREGIRYCELALPIYRELGDFRGEGIVLNNLGVHAYYEGRWDEALEFYGRSREARQRGGDVTGAAVQTNNEAEILSDQGHLERADELFRDALRACRAAGYAFGVAVLTSNLGRLAARAGRFEEAHELLDEALAEFVVLGSERFIVETTARRAECLVLEGRHREALELATGALASAERSPVGGLEALLERSAGYALHQGRRTEEAHPHFEASLARARELGAEYEVALTLRAMAQTGYPTEDDLDAESRAVLERLGVASLPKVPLP